eukprot:gene12524-13809_t
MTDTNDMPVMDSTDASSEATVSDQDSLQNMVQTKGTQPQPEDSGDSYALQTQQSNEEMKEFVGKLSKDDLKMLLQEVLSNGRGSLNHCQNLLQSVKSPEIAATAAMHDSPPSPARPSHETEAGMGTTEPHESVDQINPQPSSSLPDANHPQPAKQAIALPGWCKCGNYQDMGVPDENVCCNKKECISCYQIFGVLCLDRNVLENVVRTRCDILSDDYEFTSNEYRNAGYRQYVIWQHGKLGRGKRRVCPSCVVIGIRRAYPSRYGKYMGFKRS